VSNEGAITSRVHRAWLGGGMWWGHVAKRGLLMNKDLCKVQVNAPPSLEIPAKFFERYCALPNNSAMSAKRAS